MSAIIANIQNELVYLIGLQKSRIKKFDAQIRQYPAENEMTHKLKVYKQMAEEAIPKLEDLLHIAGKIRSELNSEALPVEVHNIFKERLERASVLLRQCKNDLRPLGEASSLIVWVHNTIPGAIRVEKRRMQAVQHQARL